MKKLSLFFVIALIISFVFSSPLFCNASGGLLISQTRIVFQADSGKTDTVPVSIVNNTSDVMEVEIRKADFEIGSDGAFIIKEPGSSQNSASALISCQESKFKMSPGSKKAFNVELIKSKELYLPEYSCAVLVKYAPSEVVSSKAMIKTYMQFAVTVRVLAGKKLDSSKVEAKNPPLEISGIPMKKIMGSGSKKTIAVSFKNTGVLTVEPRINATVSSIFSDETAGVSFGTGYVQPGQTRTYKDDNKFKTSSWFDIYTVKFDYQYKYFNKDFSGSKSYTFVVVSYQLLAGILLIFAGIVVQVVLYRKKARLIKRLLRERKEETVQAGKIGAGGGNDSSDQ